jgi:hypothetical protein
MEEHAGKTSCSCLGVVWLAGLRNRCLTFSISLRTDATLQHRYIEPIDLDLDEERARGTSTLLD